MKAMKASMCVAALALALSLGAPAHARQDEATRLDEKVSALYEAGKFAAALPLAKQALALREKALGPNDAKTALSINTLALVYYNQGRYAEAEQLYKRSLAIS